MPRLKSIIGNTAFASLFAVSIALVSFSNTALAGRVILSDTHSQSDILKSCVGAGGSFSSSSDGYACSTDKGSVSCNKEGKCYGDCPSCGDHPDTSKGGSTAEGVLSGKTLKAGTTAKPEQVAEPTQKPVIAKPVAAKPIENHKDDHPDKHPTSERSSVEKH